MPSSQAAAIRLPISGNSLARKYRRILPSVSDSASAVASRMPSMSFFERFARTCPSSMSLRASGQRVVPFSVSAIASRGKVGRGRDEVIDRRKLGFAVHIAIEDAEILQMSVAIAKRAIEHEKAEQIARGFGAGGRSHIVAEPLEEPRFVASAIFVGRLQAVEDAEILKAKIGPVAQIEPVEDERRAILGELKIGHRESRRPRRRQAEEFIGGKFRKLRRIPQFDDMGGAAQAAQFPPARFLLPAPPPWPGS